MSKENLQPKIIAGLGNPGPDYETTYHNAGLIALNAFTTSPFETYKHFLYRKTEDGILIKPDAFMNESGVAIKEALSFFKVKPEELLVIHDDSDLMLGKWKLSFDASSAGHRGIASIAEQLKTNAFWRARIGIRKEAPKREKAEKFVLRKMAAEDKETIYRIGESVREKVRSNLTRLPKTDALAGGTSAF